MNSINDGKDVKSIITPVPKGKSYFIELYKSLDARLSVQSDLPTRAANLCEAWRRVHRLCQHSSLTTHPHLISWIQRHTASTILLTEWQSPKNAQIRSSLEEAFTSFVEEADAAAAARQAGAHPWEAELLQRVRDYRKLVADPWGHPVLRLLLDPKGEQPGNEQVLEWLREERGATLVARLRQLSASKCDDLALALATAVADRTRDTRSANPHNDNEEDLGIPSDPGGSDNEFAALLKNEAGFTPDIWELLTDIELVLLHKLEKTNRCIELAKLTPLRCGYQLVERLRTRLELSPKEKKLWKNAKEVAALVAQVVVARCMVVPTCTGVCRLSLYWCARALVLLLPAARLPPATAALAAPAATARHLHTLAAAVHIQCGEEMKPFVCELYVRAITAGMNELERLKLKVEKESEARSSEQTLSNWFVQLSEVLGGSARVVSECLLTAFSVHPSDVMYQRLVAAPVAPDVPIAPGPCADTAAPEPTSEFGSWATDSHSTKTNFVKTSETLNLKRLGQQSNVLSTVVLTEGERLGLGPELCQDLAVLLSGPRLKTLMWDMDRQELLEKCRVYKERTGAGTRALTTELKYLNLDPAQFMHLPEEQDDEDDIYYGIEKGYEHLVDVQETPEEIWQQAYSPNTSERTHSVEFNSDYGGVFSSDEDCDPLSLLTEGKYGSETKVRSHSKESSKDKQSKHVHKHRSAEGEFSQSKERGKNQCVNKQTTTKGYDTKKERKKKQKPSLDLNDSTTKTPSSLSNLVGLKVCTNVIPNQTEFKKICRKKEKRRREKDQIANKSLDVTDNDSDNQGKLSLTLGEGTLESNVVFDGLFSMDDIKTISPEKSANINNSNTKMPNLKHQHKLSSLKGSIVATTSIPKMHLNINSQDIDKISTAKNCVNTTTSNCTNSLGRGYKQNISKLLQFRRQKHNKEQSNGIQNAKVIDPHNIHHNQNVQTGFSRNVAMQKPNTSVQVGVGHRNSSTKPNVIYDISNNVKHLDDAAIAYINTRWPQLTMTPLKKDGIANGQNSTSTPNAVIQYVGKSPAVHTESNSNLSSESIKVNNTTRFPNRELSIVKIQKNNTTGNVRQTPVQEKAVQSNFTDVPILKTENPPNVTDFLKNLQETTNAGTISPNKKIDASKQHFPNTSIKTYNNVSSLCDIKGNNIKSAKSTFNILQKKRDSTSTTTYSRLHYLHKNKQTESDSIKERFTNNQSSQSQESLDLAQLKHKHVQLQQNLILPVVTPNVQSADIKLSCKVTPTGHNEQVRYETVPKMVSEHPFISKLLQSDTLTKSLDTNFQNAPLYGLVTTESTVKPRNVIVDEVSNQSKHYFLTQSDQKDIKIHPQSKLNLKIPQYQKPNVHKNIVVKKVVDNSLPNPVSNIKNIFNNSIQKTTDSSVTHNTIIKITGPLHSGGNSFQREEYETKSKGEMSKGVYISQSSIPNTQKQVRNLHYAKNSNSDLNKSKVKDWEIVMNQILSHRTPSRGENALEMKLKKDSQLITCTDEVKNSKLQQQLPQPVKALPNATNLNLDTTNTGDKYEVINAHVTKSVCKKPIEPANNEILSEYNKNLSQIEANPYQNHQIQSNVEDEVLDDLFDTDLLQEISELTSDEESYNDNANTTKFPNKVEPYNQNKTVPVSVIKKRLQHSPFSTKCKIADTQICSDAKSYNAMNINLQSNQYKGSNIVTDHDFKSTQLSNRDVNVIKGSQAVGSFTPQLTSTFQNKYGNTESIVSTDQLIRNNLHCKPTTAIVNSHASVEAPSNVLSNSIQTQIYNNPSLSAQIPNTNVTKVHNPSEVLLLFGRNVIVPQVTFNHIPQTGVYKKNQHEPKDLEVKINNIICNNTLIPQKPLSSTTNLTGHKQFISQNDMDKSVIPTMVDDKTYSNIVNDIQRNPNPNSFSSLKSPPSTSYKSVYDIVNNMYLKKSCKKVLPQNTTLSNNNVTITNVSNLQILANTASTYTDIDIDKATCDTLITKTSVESEICQDKNKVLSTSNFKNKPVANFKTQNYNSSQIYTKNLALNFAKQQSIDVNKKSFVDDIKTIDDLNQNLLPYKPHSKSTQHFSDCRPNCKTVVEKVSVAAKNINVETDKLTCEVDKLEDNNVQTNSKAQSNHESTHVLKHSDMTTGLKMQNATTDIALSNLILPSNHNSVHQEQVETLNVHLSSETSGVPLSINNNNSDLINTHDFDSIERLKMKRLMIINRQMKHNSYYPPIPLSYHTLKIHTVKEKHINTCDPKNNHIVDIEINNEIVSNKSIPKIETEICPGVPIKSSTKNNLIAEVLLKTSLNEQNNVASQASVIKKSRKNKKVTTQNKTLNQRKESATNFPDANNKKETVINENEICPGVPIKVNTENKLNGEALPKTSLNEQNNVPIQSSIIEKRRRRKNVMLTVQNKTHQSKESATTIPDAKNKSETDINKKSINTRRVSQRLCIRKKVEEVVLHENNTEVNELEEINSTKEVKQCPNLALDTNKNQSKFIESVELIDFEQKLVGAKIDKNDHVIKTNSDVNTKENMCGNVVLTNSVDGCCGEYLKDNVTVKTHDKKYIPPLEATLPQTNLLTENNNKIADTHNLIKDSANVEHELLQIAMNDSTDVKELTRKNENLATMNNSSRISNKSQQLTLNSLPTKTTVENLGTEKQIKNTVIVNKDVNAKMLANSNCFVQNITYLNEDSANNMDPSKSSVRRVKFKLTDGKCFKATIAGNADVNLEKIFFDKSFANSVTQMDFSKQFTLRVRQCLERDSASFRTDMLANSTNNTSGIKSGDKIEPVETIDLISDDDEEIIYTTLKTEYGNYKVRHLAAETKLLLKHKDKIAMKCAVNVNKVFAALTSNRNVQDGLKSEKHLTIIEDNFQEGESAKSLLFDGQFQNQSKSMKNHEDNDFIKCDTILTVDKGIEMTDLDDQSMTKELITQNTSLTTNKVMEITECNTHAINDQELLKSYPSSMIEQTNNEINKHLSLNQEVVKTATIVRVDQSSEFLTVDQFEVVKDKSLRVIQEVSKSTSVTVNQSEEVKQCDTSVVHDLQVIESGRVLTDNKEVVKSGALLIDNREIVESNSVPIHHLLSLETNTTSRSLTVNQKYGLNEPVLMIDQKETNEKNNTEQLPTILDDDSLLDKVQIIDNCKVKASAVNNAIDIVSSNSCISIGHDVDLDNIQIVANSKEEDSAENNVIDNASNGGISIDNEMNLDKVQIVDNSKVESSADKNFIDFDEASNDSISILQNNLLPSCHIIEPINKQETNIQNVTPPLFIENLKESEEDLKNKLLDDLAALISVPKDLTSSIETIILSDSEDENEHESTCLPGTIINNLQPVRECYVKMVRCDALVNNVKKYPRLYKECKIELLKCDHLINATDVSPYKHLNIRSRVSSDYGSKKINKSNSVKYSELNVKTRSKQKKNTAVIITAYQDMVEREQSPVMEVYEIMSKLQTNCKVLRSSLNCREDQSISCEAEWLLSKTLYASLHKLSCSNSNACEAIIIAANNNNNCLSKISGFNDTVCNNSYNKREDINGPDITLVPTLLSISLQVCNNLLFEHEKTEKCVFDSTKQKNILPKDNILMLIETNHSLCLKRKLDTTETSGHSSKHLKREINKLHLHYELDLNNQQKIVDDYKKVIDNKWPLENRDGFKSCIYYYDCYDVRGHAKIMTDCNMAYPTIVKCSQPSTENKEESSNQTDIISLSETPNNTNINNIFKAHDQFLPLSVVKEECESISKDSATTPCYNKTNYGQADDINETFPTDILNGQTENMPQQTKTSIFYNHVKVKNNSNIGHCQNDTKEENKSLIKMCRHLLPVNTFDMERVEEIDENCIRTIEYNNSVLDKCSKDLSDIENEELYILIVETNNSLTEKCDNYSESSIGENTNELNCIKECDKSSQSNEINGCTEDSNENLTVDSPLSPEALKLFKPQKTYSTQVDKQMKRKISMNDIKIIRKKFRKSKHIDVHKECLTTAIDNTSYKYKFKRLTDYYNSIKFSLTFQFHKDPLGTNDILPEWPVNCASIAHNNLPLEDSSTDGSPLFNEEMKLIENSNKKSLTLCEEINEDIISNDISVIESDNKDVKMGFGEGSDRVIESSINCHIKLSAATLSDVKHYQPFTLSEGNEGYESAQHMFNDQSLKLQQHFSFINMRAKVKSFFEKTTTELNNYSIQNVLKLSRKIKCCSDTRQIYNILHNVPGLYGTEYITPHTIEEVVQVVQVGQLPVSAAAQNPVSCDSRVSQATDTSPSQCSVENSPHNENSQISITKSNEYTELTNADFTVPIDMQDLAEINETQSIPMGPDQNANSELNQDIPTEAEDKISADTNVGGEIENNSRENNVIQPTENNKVDQSSTINFQYETNNLVTVSEPSLQLVFNPSVQTNSSDIFLQHKQENGASEKNNQIANAMNAAGIATTNNRAHALVNILSQKLVRPHGVNAAQTTANTYSKTTSINALSIQEALAQILPTSLNHTNTDNNQHPHAQVTPQVLHFVQGKNASGNQITLLDNSQQSVISSPNATQVLHIVQNKTATSGVGTNGGQVSTTNTFSGISLVDTGLQQGNQLLHIVNAGANQKGNAGQLLKRVNLLANLANVQATNEQKMVQFVCKSADGKAIQVNAAHQRSMVLRLQPIETTNIQAATSKQVETPALSPTSNTVAKDAVTTQEIKSRSVYEENYAKFIQNSSTKPSATAATEKSTSLPKFNQAFGKSVFQEESGSQKQNDINVNSMQSGSSNSNNSECTSDNVMNLEHIGQIGSPPLLLKKPTPTSQAQPAIVQQIKQTIAPMNIQTMHGGVIYTRQIPVNIGGGQTINLITVPSTELIDDTAQKQDVKFANQGEIEPSIIKIVPQIPAPNAEVSPEEGGPHMVTPDSAQNPQPQPVLTQMRIKLPMLSKAPQGVSGARVVRPSFFQIQRNVIGGANQPVYQQLVLTAAPSIGAQTIRLPQPQVARQLKVPTENQSPESQLSSSTLEQLREFDMVLEQVKERSTVQPGSSVGNTFSKLPQTPTPSSDTTDSPVAVTTAVSAEQTQQVLYSIGGNQALNVAYVNRKTVTSTSSTTAYARSPDSSCVPDSPTSTPPVAPVATVAPVVTETQPENQPKPVKVSSKTRSRSSKPSASLPNALKVSAIPPKTSSQKPLEDEQTTQRILYILAEYKEQVENSPDKDKPAPRRRTNPPSNPSGSSKRKKGKRPGSTRDVSPVTGDDNCRTMGSEDSSCGTSQGDCNENCSMDAQSPQDSPRKVARKLTFDHETTPSTTTQPRPLPQRNVILADGQTIAVARSAGGKPATAVLMPTNYILPVSMVKSGQQIAIVTNRGGPKLLAVGQSDGGAANALLLQRLIGPGGLKPMLARPGVRHLRFPAAALHNLHAFNFAPLHTVQPAPAASPAPAPAPAPSPAPAARPEPWPVEVKAEDGSSPEGGELWRLTTADAHQHYTYEEQPPTPRHDTMDRTVLDSIPDRYSPDMEAQRIFDKMFDVDTKKSYIVDPHEESPRVGQGYDLDASHSDCDDKVYHQVVHKKDGSGSSQGIGGLHRVTHVSAAALRHKYAILEHELRLQKSLSEECEDLGVDSPSASDLFPEADLLFATSPAQDHSQDHTHAQTLTSQMTLMNTGCVPTADMDADDQTATAADDHHHHHHLLTETTAAEDELADVGLGLGLADVGVGVVALDQEEFARAHPNTTFHSEPTEDAEVQPFTISDLKGRVSSTIFHTHGAPTTVLMAAPHTVISQAPADAAPLRRAGARYPDEPDYAVEDSSRDATSSDLFWETNSESRRQLDFSSDSDKCCKSPYLDETDSTDSGGGVHLRLDSVIKQTRGRERSASSDSAPPVRTYPAKRAPSLTGKTRAGEHHSPAPRGPAPSRRASGRGVVKRGCHCCNGSPAPLRAKKPRQRRPANEPTPPELER